MRKFIIAGSLIGALLIPTTATADAASKTKTTARCHAIVNGKKSWSVKFCPKPGVNGVNGANGKDGTNGANGLAGANGKSVFDLWLGLGNEGGIEQMFESFTGPQGEDGKQGAKGDTGPMGPIGERGPQGEDGKDGESITGPQGEQGVKGDDGATGPVGPQGEQGPVGESVTGPQGPQGANGVSGYGYMAPAASGIYGTGVQYINGSGFVTVICPSGKYIVSAGAYGNESSIVQNVQRPTSLDDGGNPNSGPWKVNGMKISVTTTQNTPVQPWAICIKA